MQFSWTSFFLEIINFLVLLWILKHFFYAPVRKAIQTRKEFAENNLQQADQTQKAALELQNKYASRLQEWEKERIEKLSQLDHEMQQEKQKQLKTLTDLLNKEKEKFRAQERHSIEKYLVKKEKETLDASLKFTAKIFNSFADATLEKKIFNLLIGNLKNLPTEKLSILKAESLNEILTINVESAYPVSEEMQNEFIQVLQALFPDLTYKLNYKIESELLAGYKIAINSLVLLANLRDELKFFAEAAQNAT